MSCLKSVSAGFLPLLPEGHSWKIAVTGFIAVFLLGCEVAHEERREVYEFDTFIYRARIEIRDGDLIIELKAYNSNYTPYIIYGIDEFIDGELETIGLIEAPGYDVGNALLRPGWRLYAEQKLRMALSDFWNNRAPIINLSSDV